MTLRRLIAASGIALAAALLPQAARAEVLMERNVSMAIAKAIVEGAMEECRKNGHKVVVVVVDRAGQMVAMLRADGVNPHNFELARRKCGFDSARERHELTTELFRPPAPDQPQLSLAF